jgi:hypothetical protein
MLLFHWADGYSVAIFDALLVMILGAFFGAVYDATKDRKKTLRISAATLIYLAVFCAVVSSKVAIFYPMPGLPILFALNLLAAVGLAFSPVGRWLRDGASFDTLVIFHAFRLPLELVLHSWAKQGTIPETMTWTGQNFDIATGVAALVLFRLAGRSRAAVWLFQLIGFGLLLNVIRVAVMSAPLPFGWHIQPSMMLPFYLPYALIVPVCVGGALAGHLILFRKLLTKSPASSTKLQYAEGSGIPEASI